MLFQVHPSYMPAKSTERYEPKIFGFKIHDIAEQHRWQDRAREEFQAKLKEEQEKEKNKQQRLLTGLSSSSQPAAAATQEQ